MKIRLSAPLQYDSIVDGEGISTVLWTQGCPHKCLGCHNPTTHSFQSGYIVDTIDIIKELKENINYQDGITLSGGNPFMQPKAVNEIATFIKKINKDVWAFTGFKFEELIQNKNNNIKKLLYNIDVLVDGKFEIDKFSLDLYYRGSRNQRIIDVKKSLKQNEIVLIDRYMVNKNNIIFNIKKEKYIFV